MIFQSQVGARYWDNNLAYMRRHKLQSKTQKNGFDWTNTTDQTHLLKMFATVLYSQESNWNAKYFFLSSSASDSLGLNVHHQICIGFPHCNYHYSSLSMVCLCILSDFGLSSCSFPVLQREFARWKVRNTAIERRDLIRNPVPLMPEFQRSVRLLGRRPTTQQFIDTIIKKYGTHILISATLGGESGSLVSFAHSQAWFTNCLKCFLHMV